MALIRTAFLYALAQTITMLASPLVLRLLGGNMLRGMVFGTILSAAALIYAGALTSGAFPEGAVAMGILLGLHRAFYRAPYQLEQREVDYGRRQSVVTEITLALAPFAAALLIASAYYYSHLLLFAGVLQILALVPLLYVPRVQEEYSWSYRRAFGELVELRNQALVSHGFFLGITGGLLFFMWPLLLFVFFSPSPIALGAAFSGTLFLIFAFRYSRARVVIDQHADDATYIDEYTILKEMALAAGRLTVGLITATAFAILF